MTSYHVLDHDQNAVPLILDCDYNVDPNERGFVLKWLFNGSRIFQWIPNQWPSYGSVSWLHRILKWFTKIFGCIVYRSRSWKTTSMWITRHRTIHQSVIGHSPLCGQWKIWAEITSAASAPINPMTLNRPICKWLCHIRSLCCKRNWMNRKPNGPSSVLQKIPTRSQSF